MKNLLICLLALTSLGATAGLPDASTPWSKLGRTTAVIFEMPQFAMSQGYFLRAPSVCVDGDDLRSIKARKKCIRWQSGRNNDRCLEYQEVYPRLAIEGTKEYCSRWAGGGDGQRCVEWTTYDYKLPLSYEIPVYRRISGRDGDDMDRSRTRRPLFTKNFTINACE